ncbi:uncharacterized protein [Asterias amurensis]
MKAPLGLTLCLLAHFLVEVTCGGDGGFNIHGGYSEVFNADSTSKLATIHEWGAFDSGSQSNRKVIDGPDGFCWYNNELAYCFVKFVVSSTSQPNEEHYQIEGSKMVIKDSSSSYTVQDYGWGVQEAYDEVEGNIIADGYIWSGNENDWGYGYLHLFVKKTTRPSLSDAFLFERRNAGSESLVAESIMTGQKTPTSVPQKLSDFQCWTSKWSRDSIGRWTMYRPQTKLVDYNPIYAEKTVEPIESHILKSLTLENQGSGVTSNDFAKLGSSETISLSSTTSISTTFDFEVDIGSSVSMDIGFVSSSLDINLHFGYSSTSATEETQTSSTTSTISWPSTCPPGIRIDIDIYKITEKQTVPIEFTFECNGEQFSETRTLEATVNKLKQQLTNCCLTKSASPQCGSPELKMC